MANKAYIVANKQQEREVLDKLEREGLTWIGGHKATQIIPSNGSFVEFPYVLFKRNKISWGNIGDLINEKIIYDGRKGEQMSEKYVVSQEFMNELKDWKENNHLQPRVSFDGQYVSWQDLESIPMDIKKWLHGININDIEINNRLITILRWVNGEDVFEVEKPKKWVVRSIGLTEDDERYYVSIGEFMGLKRALNTYIINQATRFDTKEEAQSWANSHQEVVEVEE